MDEDFSQLYFFVKRLTLQAASMYDVTMAEYMIDGCDFSNVDLEFATIIKVNFSKAEVRGFFTYQQAFFWQVTLPDGIYVEGPLFNP